MKKQEKRLRDILGILQVESAASTRELSQKLQVTEMTIRRDLGLLSRSKQVRLIHGGAIYTGDGARRGQDVYSFSHEETRSKDEKTRIGSRAAGLIRHGDTIILDGGSTVEYVARAIPPHLDITVLCYSLNLLNMLCRNPGFKKIVSGGYYNDDSLMFEGTHGVELIRSMRASKAFIGATGVNCNLGLTCKNLAEVQTKKAVIASTDTRILVVDSTKFGQVHIAHFAELEDFDMIITDSGIPGEYQNRIQEKGIQLHVV
ncbi:MAG: DeoR/GlpR family DNA-binding transcription regulator [Spirochaetota bacterium]